MLNNSPNYNPNGGGCRSFLVNLVIGFVVIAGIVVLVASGLDNSTRVERAQEIAHEEAMAQLPKTLEERQVDALENVAVKGFTSNVAIAASADASQTAMAWSNAVTLFSVALILIAVAMIVALLSRKSSPSPNPITVGRTSIPDDVPTYIRNRQN